VKQKPNLKQQLKLEQQKSGVSQLQKKELSVKEMLNRVVIIAGSIRDKSKFIGG
jgi:hypothetical protein